MQHWTLFAPDDRRRRVLLQRQLIGHASCLMFVLPLGLALHWGWLDLSWAALGGLTALAVLLNLGFFVLIRSGLTAGWRDPGLLQPQLYAAVALALVIIHATQHARSLMLMLFVVLQFFGVFGLAMRQYARLALTIILGYAGLVALEAWVERPGVLTLRTELLRLLVLAMMSLWMASIGSYVAGLREALVARRRELADALERLRETAERDHLTGAYDRHYLMALLADEQERADRFGTPFSVALLDIDHFKAVNDTHGHQAGDEVLQGFSQRVRACARGLDRIARPRGDHTFGRFGGEEFLLVMPHTQLDGALACVERLRAAVAGNGFPTTAGTLTVTFSAGIAEHRSGEGVALLLRRADTALYRAKTGGRDRTCLDDAPDVPSGTGNPC